MFGPRRATPYFFIACVLVLLERTAAIVDRVRCGSTTGDVVIDVHHDWAPIGAHRFMELVHYGKRKHGDNMPTF
jgi:hypothetical protein